MATGPRIYNLFPLLAGAMADWHRHLPRIAGMGFDWIYVNPYHYPGASGSLYAVQDPHRLHPVVQGDSPEDQATLVRRFTDAAAEHGIRVMADLVINHTAKDAKLADEHPEWYLREEDGSIYSPRAVAAENPKKVTVWRDLGELDYESKEHRDAQLAYWQDIIRAYVEQGIRGFRCDAAYQVGAEIWHPVIVAAREIDPGTLFAAETLGCTPKQVVALKRAGFDYLFNSSKWWAFEEPWLLEQYDAFRTIAPSIAFPESHDTPRLVTEVKGDAERHYRLRYLFAAAFSSGVMMPMGYEYGFEKKLHVVDSRPEDWAREADDPRFDLTGFVGAVNRMKADTPVLNVEGCQELLTPEEAQPVALARYDAGSPEEARQCAVTLVNPDKRDPAALAVRLPHLADGRPPHLTEITPERPAEPLNDTDTIEVGPLEVRVFAT